MSKAKAKKTTTASAVQCKVGKPTCTRAQYNAAKRRPLAKSDKASHARSASGLLTTSYEYPHVYDYPSYGQPCSHEAYLEMTAWWILAKALDKWIAAQSASYMPPQILQQLQAAYMTAMANYNAAWWGFETCINGTPV